MMCAWKELLGILPVWLRSEVDVLGRDNMEALRLRINAPPEMVNSTGTIKLSGEIHREDILFVVNQASHYSPWAAESTARGYLTAPGGHRIGLCGEAIVRDGHVTGLREITSLCIRVARDIPNLGREILQAKGSAIILGAPGWGKTTLLRGMIRQLGTHYPVAVVDERGEVFPLGFPRGQGVDVLLGTGKSQGIDMVLRSMGPEWIAVDEITSQSDSAGLLDAQGCGVNLLATAHASSLEDFYSRAVYRPLVQTGVFKTCFLMKPDKSFRVERMYS